MAGDRAVTPWQVSVLNDENFDIRAIFERWNTSINSLEGNLRTPFSNIAQNGGTASAASPIEGYKTVCDVYQHGKTGNTLKGYQMIGAWPASVGAIRVAWEDQNQIEVFDVTFRYDYWLPIENLGESPDRVVV